MKSQTLQQIYHEIEKCTRCRLHTYRFRAVLPEGNALSRVLILAQSPGKQENTDGKMFTGPSGKIFDHLLDIAGLSREDFYLTNLLKCMLPNARRPRNDEINACMYFLEREAELIQPVLWVPLGFHSLRTILKKFALPVPDRKAIKNLFGLLIRKDNIMIFPLRHPTALLFNPEKEDEMRHNYTQLRKIIKQKEFRIE